MKVPEGFVKTKYNRIYINRNGIVFFSNDHPNAKPYPTLYTDRDGYLRLWVTNDLGQRKFILYHRLIMETFGDKKFHHLTVNHKDGDKLNNNLSNLEWMTVEQNLKHQHRELKVNYATGERHGGSKLNEKSVKEIIESNEKPKVLSSLYGISTSQVNRIKRMENWTCLKKP